MLISHSPRNDGSVNKDQQTTNELNALTDPELIAVRDLFRSRNNIPQSAKKQVDAQREINKLADKAKEIGNQYAKSATPSVGLKEAQCYQETKDLPIKYQNTAALWINTPSHSFTEALCHQYIDSLGEEGKDLLDKRKSPQGRPFSKILKEHNYNAYASIRNSIEGDDDWMMIENIEDTQCTLGDTLEIERRE